MIEDRLTRLAALSSGDLGLDALIRSTCARALGLAALPAREAAPSEHAPVVEAFTEQFATDVTGIDAHLRSQLLDALGNDAFRVVAAIFIADFVPRVWAGSDALGMGRPGQVDPVEWDDDTDPTGVLLGGFVPAVARLRALDPVTTEVVRLRGAAAHNCRLCKSLREERALQAGGSESLYDEIAEYGSSKQLSDKHKAALAYVDALVWSPAHIGAQIVAGMREHFSDDEALELTLDVMRNACNKIAVSLGADAPRVAEGTERYLVDEDGQTVFAT